MTFSIIARDPDSGAFGVATATGGPAVGSLVPHAMASIGALATQGYTNPYYAHDGLALLSEGLAAEDVVARLTGSDSERDKRQVIVIDTLGRTAGWTGPALSEAAGMILDSNLAVAGNLLVGRSVLGAMHETFLAGSGSALEIRLLWALEAGQVAGGDRRGTVSAALKTFTDQLYPAIDIRIDLSTDPIEDLARLLEAVRDGEYADFVAELPQR